MARLRTDSDEAYVLDLCDTVLGVKAERQKRFAFLVGDPGRDGLCRMLPVDGFYTDRMLVIEYHERQHNGPVRFFDDRLTISGVPRGEQRRIYDIRREVVLADKKIALVKIDVSALSHDRRGKLLRSRETDVETLRVLLALHVRAPS
jgi:hypothetical protein